MPDLERNKEAMLAFYDMAFDRSRTREAMERYGGDTYSQHTPLEEVGREGFVAHVEEMHRRDPATHAVLKHILAKRDLAVPHRLHERPGEED